MTPVFNVEPLAAAKLPVDLAVGTVVGEYVIERKLDEGGMATVYGAAHPLIGKQAAIKVMSPAMSADLDQVRRFVQEARAVNAIRHPNIVEVFGFGELADGRSYFMMEWLKGETLHDRMWERRVPLEETLHIVDVICEALEAAHEHGIVHRDLKPGNVFLVPRRGHHPTPKLLDFGVAKLMRADEGAKSGGPKTLSGLVVGTPSYISPEQARGLPVDGRSDLYSLGVMLYELVLGTLPFVAESAAELLHHHIVQAPAAPSSLCPAIPPALEALILGLLEKDPARRPGTVEIRTALAALRVSPRVQSPTEPAALRYDPAWSRASSPRTRRSKLVMWSSLVVGLCLVGTAGARHRWATQAIDPVVSQSTLQLAPRPAARAQVASLEIVPAKSNRVRTVPHDRRSRHARRLEVTRAPAPETRHDPDYLVDPFTDRTP